MSKRIALAIDAGFGMVKFSTRDPKTGDIRFDHFPSAAIDAPPVADSDSLNSVGANRDVKKITYEGREYLVGHDVRHEMVGNDFGRDMTDAYYDSAVYHSLMRGALLYMNEPRIHTLCLGLPMNHHSTAGRVEKLINAYSGEIQLTADQSVTIDKVLVQPQPFGAYVSLGKRWKDINPVLVSAGMDEIKKASDLREMTILIVDPGEYTLDWLVMQAGSPLMKVSNAIGDAGRHRVVRDVFKLIQEQLGRPLGTSYYADIDLSLRTGKKLRIAGRSFNLHDDEYQQVVRRSIDDPVRQLFEGLRGAEDRIDLAVVMGGAPDDVAAAIKRHKSWMPVYMEKSREGNDASIYGNLAGFQIWAEQNSKGD